MRPIEFRRLCPPRALLGVVLVALAVMLFFRHLAGFSLANGPVPQDFSVYLRAAERTRAGLSPYHAEEYLAYKYSPGLLGLLLLMPTHAPAAWLWVKSLYLIIWATTIFVASRARTFQAVGLVVVGIALSYKGLLECLDYGQFEFILLGITLASAVLLRRRPLLAGFVTGALPWLKLPWGLVWLGFVIVASRWGARYAKRLVLGIAIAAVFWCGILPLAVLGPDQAWQWTFDWVTVLRDQPHAMFGAEEMNQSLWAVLSRNAASWRLGIWASQAIAFVLMTILAILAGRSAWRRDHFEKARAPLAWTAPWILLTLLASPLSWRWGSLAVVGAPLAIASVHAETRTRRIPWLAYFTVLVAIFLLHQNPVVRALGYAHWNDLHSAGLVCALWIWLLVGAVYPSPSR